MKEGWTYKKLGEVARVQNGYAFNSKLFNEKGDGTPLIRIRDIKRGFSYTYTTEDCEKDFIVENDDLLIGMDGDFNVCTWKGGHSYLNQRVCHVVPSNAIKAKFLHYFLPYPLQKINDKTAFSTVKHLSSKQVNTIVIPVPPLSEQQRIVSYLDSAFAQIEELKAKSEKQLSEAKSLFQKALNEAMEPKEGWEKKTFGNVCSYHKEQGRFKNMKYIGMEHMISGTGEIQGFMSSNNVLSNSFKFNKGDVLYGRLRPYLKKVYIAEFDGCCSTEVFPIISDYIESGLIKYWFLTDETTNKINATSAGCRMPRGNMNEVKKFMFVFPKQQKAQHRIVTYLDTISAEVKQLEENLKKVTAECDALKQSLLREVFE